MVFLTIVMPLHEQLATGQVRTGLMYPAVPQVPDVPSHAGQP